MGAKVYDGVIPTNVVIHLIMYGDGTDIFDGNTPFIIKPRIRL
jgi:hypothetical protein